jgi:hypothetical protein
VTRCGAAHAAVHAAHAAHHAWHAAAHAAHAAAHPTAHHAAAHHLHVVLRRHHRLDAQLLQETHRRAPRVRLRHERRHVL